MALGYATATQVAKYLGWDHEDAGLMEQITLILDYVEPQIDAYCNTTFVASTGVKTFDGTGNQLLQTNTFIRTITAAAWVDEDAVELSDIDLGGIVLGPSNSRDSVYKLIERRKGHGPWTEGVQNIKLTGTWGYATTPAPVTGAVALTCKSFFDTRDYNHLIAYESNLSRNTQFRPDIEVVPQPAQKVLNYYRFQPIAFP